MTSREEFRKYRSTAHKQEINIHGGTYSDVPQNTRSTKAYSSRRNVKFQSAQIIVGIFLLKNMKLSYIFNHFDRTCRAFEFEGAMRNSLGEVK